MQSIIGYLYARYCRISDGASLFATNYFPTNVKLHRLDREILHGFMRFKCWQVVARW